MSCDDERGYVYLPVGTASNEYYGARRPGATLYSESLVVVDEVQYIIVPIGGSGLPAELVALKLP